MRSPLVSCIVPVFNGERYLAECLDSILGQTHRPLEIIVVDDGSTDGSAELVSGYGPTVRYEHQVRRGPGAACNRGVALAGGSLVSFLEQDDVWLPAKVQAQVEAFEADPALDYCVTRIENFWIPELAGEQARFRDAQVMQPVPGYVVQTLMARPSTFVRIGPFSESHAYTFGSEWFVRAQEAGANERLLPDVLTRRRLHHDNYSRRNRAASHDEFLHVVKDALDRRRGRRP